MPMMNRNRKDDTRPRRYPHYTHAPTKTIIEDIEVEVLEDGKLVLRQNHPDGEYDEIQTSFALINKLSYLKMSTRKTVWKDTPYNKDK